MITNAGALVGGDAAAHMAEELKSASKVLPRAMIWTITVNGLLGFIMLVSVALPLSERDEPNAAAALFFTL